MKRILSDEYYHHTNEDNTILNAEGMFVIMISNIILLYTGVNENHVTTLSFAQAFIIAILTIAMILIQAIFGSIAWNSLYYKIVAKIAILLIFVDLSIMIASLIGLI